MSQKIRTSVEIDGSLSASQIANATTDTDKFLVSDGGVVKYRTGAEVLSDLGVTEGTASKIQHQVKAGVAINKGQAVYVTSADGTNIIVGLASNSSEATSSKTMGLLNATVSANGFADVVAEGLLDGLNTIGATAGDPVWLGTNGNLIYGLANKPYAPNHLVFIGIVTRVNANNGEIFVKVQNGFELGELHDVDLKTTTPINGHLLGFNGTLWVNKTIAGWLGYTPANQAITIETTAPLSGGGDLSANRTLSISQAGAASNGYLSSTDWNTFNSKQAAGNYITALTGEATASGPGSASITLSNSAVTGKLLTGVNITGGTVVGTDSILTAFGKLQNQINGLIGGSIYQGTWNASTNTPSLSSGVGTKGYYYIVNVAGSTNLNGITDWKVGDWAIYDGTAWQKVDNTDAVSSVNGFTGAVSLTTSNISEGLNLYYTDARSRLSLSFAAGSGAYNNSTGVITIPTNNNQILNGSNFITLTSLSGVTPINYNNTTGSISITQATTSTNGYLSSTDWNTFNNKQNALTDPVTGTGTTNYLPKFTGSSTLGNSSIQDNGSLVTITNATKFIGLNTIQGTTSSDTAPLGSELLTTGTSDASWTGTSFATGYTHIAGSITTLTSTLAATIGTYYQITYTVTGRTAGSFTIDFGGSNTSGITATGAVGPLASTTSSLVITPTTDFNGTIILSIKTIGASSASITYLDSSGGISNELRISKINTNIFLGRFSGIRNTTGGNNNAIGYQSLNANTTGNNNNAIGVYSLSSNTTGSNNNAIGTGTLQRNTTGSNNNAIGSASLYYNTTGGNNNAIGSASLYSNTTGSNNNAIGISSLYSNTTGSNNNAIGFGSLNLNTTGSYNSTIGYVSLTSNTTGSNNSAIGYASLISNTTGSNNSAIGGNSGRYIADKTTAATILNNSVMLGFRTSPLADNQTNQIVIGYDATGLGSNTTVIGNSSTAQTWIGGKLTVGKTTNDGINDIQANGTVSSGATTLGTSQPTANNQLTRKDYVDTADALKANLASPTFTGTPTAPTAAAGTNTTQIATTEFVNNGLATKQNALTNPITGTGTTNYLSKFTGSGTLGNSLIYDNGTNVGIGTTAPSYKLTVRNDVAASTSLDQASIGLYNNSDGGSAIYFSNAVGGQSKISFGVESTGAGTDDTYVGFSTGANTSMSERMRITSNGNVGIGTTAPATKLDITDTFRVQSSSFTAPSNGVGLELRNVSGTSSLLSYDRTNSLYKPMILDGSDVLIKYSGNNGIFLNSSGNVGIGTPSPTAKLDVRGELFFTNISTTDGTNVISFSEATDRAFSIKAYLSGTGSTGNKIGIGSNIVGWESNIMTWQGNGNVGIGTTSPTHLLSVQNESSYEIASFKSSSVPYQIIGNAAVGDYWRGFFTGQNIVTNATTGKPSVRVSGYTASAIAYSADSSQGYLGFFTTNSTTANTDLSERMRITSSGNVCIGTTTDAGYKLDVNGTGRFSGIVTSNTYFYAVGTPPATNGGLFFARDTNANGSNTSFGGVFFNSSPGYDYAVGKLTEGANGFFQIRNGNTGAELLRMNSTGAATFSSSVTANNFLASNGGLFGWGNGSTFIDGDSSNQYIRAIVNNTERLRITSSGNVDIGTALLDINGSSTVQQNLSIANDRQFSLYSDGTRMILNSVKNVPLAIYTNDTERMRIFSSGNVFIGPSATDAGFRLDVNGTGRFSGSLTASGILSTSTNHFYNANELRLYNSNNTNWGVIKGSSSTSLGDISILGGSGNGIFVASGGYVGIGTTSPTTARFQVNSSNNLGAPNLGAGAGVTLVAAANGLYGLYTGVSADGYAWMQNTRNDGTADAYDIVMQPKGGKVGIGTVSPSTKLHIQDTNGGIFFDGSGATYNRFKSTTSSASVGRDLLFSTQNSGTTPDLYVNSSGNVGIGTSSPSGALHVATFGQYSYFSANSGGTAIADVQGLSIGWNKSSGAGETIIAYNKGGGSTGGLAFSNNDGGVYNERMRITSSGNVGIGTPSPSYKLDLLSSNPRLRVKDSSTGYSILDLENGSGSFYVGNDNSTGSLFGGSAYAGILYRSGAYPISIWTNATERMRIFSSGNVFIGSSPVDAGYKLDVAGTGRVTGSLTIDSATTPFLYFHSTRTSGQSGYIKDDGNMVFQKTEVGGGFRFLNSSSAVVLSIDTGGASTFINTVTATGFFNSSDIRLKEIVDYDYNVSDIKPITYLWKDGRDDKKHVGYSAQEVQKVMPDAVNEGEDGMLSVNYVEVLVAQVELLNNRMAEMQKEIELLKSK